MKSCLGIAMLLCGFCVGAQDVDEAEVTRPPDSLGLDPFYEKYVSAKGIAVVSSAKVPDRALLAAADIVDQMLVNRQDVREELIKAGIRVGVMAKSEVTTDLPEHSDLTPKQHWDTRTRGVGATPARPVSSCAEENLLGDREDRYLGESIHIHEFAHTIHENALVVLNPQFDDRLKAIYDRAMKKGLWQKTYAATDHKEYWAEGVQCWFDANLTADPPDGIHNNVGTRAALKRYDPELADLVAEVFGEVKWRWNRPGAHKQRRGR